MKNKSAKDMAFEKERAKYRQKIRELEHELNESKKEIYILKESNEKLESKCEELKDWINRLLEYTDMSEEDMKAIIEKEKASAEAMEHLNDIFGVMSRFRGGYGGLF